MLKRIFSFVNTSGLASSQLYNEQTFYRAFIRDLSLCKSEAIIESPFITSKRVASLLPIFSKMRSRGVRIVVNTRHPDEHNMPYSSQAWEAIEQMQQVGIEVLFTGGHHRKLAIIDRKILWEGSLNILSQNESCEIMRRMESADLAREMIRFIKVEAHI